MPILAFGIPATKQIGPLPGVDFSNLRGIGELVENALRDKIVSGEFRPGTVLLQRDLAEAFGVSREPVRSALVALESEGLVLSRPRRSAVVAPITAQLIADVYEIRAELDGLVARRAASQSDGKRELLASLTDLTDAAATASNHRVFVELDHNFHRVIYEAAGNAVALDFFDSRWVIIGRVISLIAASGYLDTAWKQHEAIVKAICDGDPKAAEVLSRRHATEASSWLVRNVALLDEAPMLSNDDSVE